MGLESWERGWSVILLKWLVYVLLAFRLIMPLVFLPQLPQSTPWGVFGYDEQIMTIGLMHTTNSMFLWEIHCIVVSNK